MRLNLEKGIAFLAGVGITCLLVFSIGAAATQVQADRYDANLVFGGVAMKILDHRSNTMYIYTIKKGTKDTYELERTVDLNLAGQAEIKVDRHKHDDEKQE